jgi:hypothetical protein
VEREAPCHDARRDRLSISRPHIVLKPDSVYG